MPTALIYIFILHLLLMWHNGLINANKWQMINGHEIPASIDPVRSMLYSQKPTTRPFLAKLQPVKPYSLSLQDPVQYCLCIYTQTSGFFSRDFPDHNFAYNSHFPHASHTSLLSHSRLLNHPNNNEWTLRIQQWFNAILVPFKRMLSINLLYYKEAQSKIPSKKNFITF